MPLGADEVIECFRKRWNATYDVQLVVRRKSLYFQVMWAYLEQQSFPLNEEEYRSRLNNILEIVNRLGQSEIVREWLATTPKRPRIGKAISLSLKGDGRFKEFVL